MAKLNIGDVVCLKSGGDKMTIESIFAQESEGLLSTVYHQLKMGHPQSDTFYACVWFDEKHNLKRDTFAEELLEIIE